MHILFVHQNFPAQFGHIASHLAERHGFRCTFVSQRAEGHLGGVERIRYRLRGGATIQTHYCSRTFENAIWHAHAVFHALKSRPDIQPDLIVGHSGFGSTLFLRELYDCPIINYFEYFYRTKNSDVDFRADFPCTELDKLRARARNAMLLLDLDNCQLGYSPTAWQRSCFPATSRDKIQIIFDGIDTELWRPLPAGPRRVGDRQFPDDIKIVTYVSRGMESMRGFDIFMKVAKRLCDERQDCIFLIAGEDRICYGGDEQLIGRKSFKDWVLAQDNYDLARFIFLGRVPPAQLVQLFGVSDLHIYLTVPFVLSWSLMDALACGATVLASDTAPVREMITAGQTGLLTDFFDVDGWVRVAHRVLEHPAEFEPLGQAGLNLIRERYSLEICLPRMLELYEQAMN